MAAASTPRKRPWYLIVALLATLGMGVTSSCNGYGMIAYYRGATLDPSLTNVGNEVDHAAIAQAMDHLGTVLDASKGRLFPLSVAALILGVATLVFAIRAMGGRAAARTPLVQLVVVQAILSVATFVLTKDVRTAFADLDAARGIASIHERAPDDPVTAEYVARFYTRLSTWAPQVILALQSLGSALIVIALTRARTREFFDAASDPAIEQ
jgi:hypothetical protein